MEDEIIVAEVVMVEDTHCVAKFVVNLDIERKNAEKDLKKIYTDGKTPRKIRNLVHMPIIYLFHRRQDHRITLFGIQTAEQLTM